MSDAVIDDYLVEIWFRIEKDRHGYPESTDWEQLLARPLLERDDYFQIESVPFYLREISRGDIVQAAVSHNSEAVDGEIFEFDKVIKRGGHNTYRLLLKKKRPQDPEFTQNELLQKGLAVEMKYDGFFAVDVPPSVDQKPLTNTCCAKMRPVDGACKMDIFTVLQRNMPGIEPLSHV